MDLEASPKSMTSGRLLGRNVLWNGIGILGPMLLAIVALPVLIRCLGPARFGVLTLIWGVVRYSSYCDFGIGSALTKLVADRISSGDEQNVTPLIWTAFALNFSTGTIIAGIFALVCPWLVLHCLRIPANLQWETEHAFFFLAASMPLFIMTGGLRGTLAAYQRFDVINAIRGPIDALSYICLMFSAEATTSITGILGVLMAIRVVGFGLYVVAALRIVPDLRRAPRLGFKDGILLFRLGGWITVSNVVNPLLADFDRFVLGALVSVDAVAYYNTAGELISKIWQIPLLLETTWFSAFSHGFRAASLRHCPAHR